MTITPIPSDLNGGDVEIAAWSVDLIPDALKDYIIGRASDKGDWLCTYCSMDATSGDENQLVQWAQFITSVVNPQLWPGGLQPNGSPNPGRWVSGDTLALCDGNGTCLIIEYVFGRGSFSWMPTLRKNPIKDDQRKYKNVPTGVSSNGSDAGSIVMLIGSPAYLTGTMVQAGWLWRPKAYPPGTVIVGPLTPVVPQPPGGGGCAGHPCVSPQ